jgi:putative nucleotidyltransferase with HDIG domain
MYQLSVIGDTCERPDDLGRQLSGLLSGVFELEFISLESTGSAPPKHHTLVDIDLSNAPVLSSLKDWLRTRPKDAKVVFVTDKASRLQEARAFALGATAIVHRPFDAATLLTKLCGDTPMPASIPAHSEGEQAPAVVAAAETLKSVFSSVCSGAPIELAAVQQASDAVVDQIEAQGLSPWIETVRMHHSQTYQHCLLVTGVAVAFGQQIGVSRVDRQRLSFAGMLHDVGKARIPLAILEKPGRLDDDEMAVIRKHPQYGLDALETSSALPAEMLDMVVHHHELLDGSGYPHGLMASEISDLVRIITISDIFGALVERRSYKAPLSGDAAYQILLDMGPKLDKDLVRAFEFASRINPRN